MMKIQTTAIIEEHLAPNDLVIVDIDYDELHLTEIKIKRYKNLEIGFVEATYADPQLMAVIEAYRAGKLRKD